jgi:hypothetical protein
MLFFFPRKESTLELAGSDEDDDDWNDGDDNRRESAIVGAQSAHPVPTPRKARNGSSDGGDDEMDEDDWE